MLQKPTTAPTERSMPPVMMTKVSPIARMAIIAPWRARFVMLFSVQKVGVAKARMTHINSRRPRRVRPSSRLTPALGRLFALASCELI